MSSHIPQLMKVIRSKRRHQSEKTIVQRVDFHIHANDFKCALLASLGWTTAAIMEETDLTQGQVQYRINKFEEGRKRGALTHRASYRQGTSPIARSVVNMFIRRESRVNKLVVRTLDQRGLYADRATGVLK